MATYRTGTVTEIVGERAGLQRVRVAGLPQGDLAYCLTELVGTVGVGDDVIVNTTAVELGLGTGGWHVVHWNLARGELTQPGPDHIMKLRYTSLQCEVGTDELRHPNLPLSLRSTPVVACAVHSQIAAVAAVVKDLRPDATVVFVMSDGAALPIALSDLVDDLRSRALIDATVTAGHAFGGDLEAVGVPSALQLAVHVAGADVVIAGIGPGVVGTGTTLGNTGADAAWALSAARALDAAPILAVRASNHDPRARHRGVSHHSATVLRLASGPVWVARVPDDVASLPNVRVRDVAVPDTVALLASIRLRVTTMGRLPEDDPLYFHAAGAAGAVAVDLLDER